MESAAHERTLKRRLRLAPLRAESPRSVQAVRGSWHVGRSERNKQLPMNLPSGGAFSAALRRRRCPAQRSGRMRWSSRGIMAPIRVQNGRLKLPMNRRIDQKVRGASIRQPVNRTARRVIPLRRPAGERAGSELARARSEPGEVEQSVGSCPVSRSKENGQLSMNLPSFLALALKRALAPPEESKSKSRIKSKGEDDGFMGLWPRARNSSGFLMRWIPGLVKPSFGPVARIGDLLSSFPTVCQPTI